MRRLVVPLLAIVLALVAGRAHAGPPTDQLKAGIDRVLVILQDPALKTPAKAEERRQKIRAIANEVFDWQETGKRALARHWQARSPQERDEFSKLFADLLERSYIGKIETYSGGERVQYLGEFPDGDLVTVRTRIVTKAGTEIPIDYRMHRAGDRWLVYDVVIEGVSLVANYRTQFNRIIQQTSFKDLLAKLAAKK